MIARKKNAARSCQQATLQSENTSQEHDGCNQSARNHVHASSALGASTASTAGRGCGARATSLGDGSLDVVALGQAEVETLDDLIRLGLLEWVAGEIAGALGIERSLDILELWEHSAIKILA